MPAVETIPPCTYCGKTYEQAWAEADAAGDLYTGWSTQHGPGDFRDSSCKDCEAPALAAYRAAMDASRAPCSAERVTRRGDLSSLCPVCQGKCIIHRDVCGNCGGEGRVKPAASPPGSHAGAMSPEMPVGIAADIQEGRADG